MTGIFSLEHAPYEDPGSISDHLETQGYAVSNISLYRGDPLPDPEEVRFLIIMGGPMSIHDEERHPWLSEEKKFIKDVISLNPPVLGICLGAQLLSDALDGEVGRADVPEYGWHEVRKTSDCTRYLRSAVPLLEEIIPDRILVFQWHQDTFSLPAGSVHLYSSNICQNQGFVYNERIIGLQFHPELKKEAIIQFLSASKDEIAGKDLRLVSDHIISHLHFCREGNLFAKKIVDYLTGFI